MTVDFVSFFLGITLLMFSVVRGTCLEQIRGPEAAHPKEAALGWGRPHPSDEMEDVRPGSGTLEAKELIVVGQGVVDDGPEVTIRQVRVQASPELNHAPAVVVQPPVVLDIKHSSTWKIDITIRNQSNAKS